MLHSVTVLVFFMLSPESPPLAPRNAGVFTCCEGSTNLGLLTDSLAVSETSSMSGYVWVQSRNAMVQGYFEPQILICINHLRLGHPNPTNIRCKKSKNWELKWLKLRVSNGCKFRRMSKSRLGEFGRWGLKCVDRLNGKNVKENPACHDASWCIIPLAVRSARSCQLTGLSYWDSMIYCYPRFECGLLSNNMQDIVSSLPSLTGKVAATPHLSAGYLDLPGNSVNIRKSSCLPFRFQPSAILLLSGRDLHQKARFKHRASGRTLKTIQFFSRVW